MTDDIGEPPLIEKFIDFWGGIWRKEHEKDKENQKHAKRGKSKRQRIQYPGNQFRDWEPEKKKLTASGVLGIQNYWWKRFVAAKDAFTRARPQMKIYNEFIPAWCPEERKDQIKNHVMEKNNWDRTIRTADQLIIHRCIIYDLTVHLQNLTVACNGYNKAYDNVHHDWILCVYRWIRIALTVVSLWK